jgi:phage N-6-adenine-methyltransferase
VSYSDWYQKDRWQLWQTPRSIFDPLNVEFQFNLDGAASEGNSLLPESSTTDRQVSWVGRRVFCNPPWSGIPPFVEAAAGAEAAVLLVPARTNARWFHRALELGAEPRFFLGRPRFEGKPTIGNSPVDCLFLIWGGAA